jgi:succinate dehydrogenase / fumarate reductase, cytochrome b subunit
MMANRPLSPHIFIYRFAYTMALSILHRATGLLLTAGLTLLVVFVASVAMGEHSYAGFRAFAGSIAGRLLIAAFLIGFCYHLANGIRHLTWDMGFGMERAQARRSGAIVVAVTVLGAAVVLWKVFAAGVAS